MLEEALAATQEAIMLLMPYAERAPEGVAAQRVAILEQDGARLRAMLNP